MSPLNPSPRAAPQAATCPRCGGGFECGAEAGHCDCFELRLSEAQRAEIAARYEGCLCLRCLRDLATPRAGASGAA